MFVVTDSSYCFFIGRQIHQDLVEKLANRNVQPVIDAIFHAAFSRNPKKRYVVGKDGNTIWMLMTVLPTFLGDFILNAITKPQTPFLMKNQ